jgi:hypothetical protein
MPLYPSIVLRTMERALTPCPSDVFSLGLTFESCKELGVRHFVYTLPCFHPEKVGEVNKPCEEFH